MDRYEKSAAFIMKRGDAAIAERKRRKAVILRSTAALTFGTAAALGICISLNVMKTPRKPAPASSGIITETGTSAAAPSTAAVTTSVRTSTASTASTVTTQTTAATSSATATSASTAAVQTSETATSAVTTSERVTDIPSRTPVTSSPLSLQTPPDSRSFSFSSYSELYKALNNGESLIGDESDYGEIFNNTASAFENNDIDLLVPAVNEHECDLRNREGFSNISLMSAELYNLPWIWYHCKVNESNIDIKLAYLSIIEAGELSSAKTYCDILKQIAPDAPNPNNYQKYESYQRIYESEIRLADDKYVTAMVSEIKNNSNIYVMFDYDGILVSVYADESTLSEPFWSSFSLKKYLY